MYQLELARTGKTLFKIRGYYLTSVIFIGTAIAFYTGATGPFQSAEANQIWFWVSLSVACCGALIRIVTSGFAAVGTSGNTKVQAIASELNTTGPYSLVRNPLYVGRIVNFTGIAMLSGSWVFGALTFLIFVLIYERISAYEEEFLRKEFPKAHAQWANEVPFLLPRLNGWIKPKYKFWVRRAIRREDKKIFWLITAVMLHDFARHGFDFSQLPEDMTFYYLWVVALVLEVITRSMLHFSKTFDNTI
jgi:protein-S-isoprenylcysteine O-methyltransferase Ste14